MFKKVLTGEDICSIVKACASSGVTELTLGDLSIKLGHRDIKTEHNIHYEIQPTLKTHLPLSVNEEEDLELAKEQELDDLFHNNPAEYERVRLEE